METVAFCENDEPCRKVLRKHWPGVPIHEDVRNLDGQQYQGAVELVCGGWPCQPVSRAGKRLGREDDRWLWPDLFRIIEESKPDWFIGENSVDIIGMELDQCINDLESIGYTVRAFDIPLAAVGLQTVERHLWLIASTISIRRQGGKKDQDTNSGEQVEFQGSDQGMSIRWHLPESRVCRSHKGIPGGVDRLRQLGNAVPPQIPEIIGRAIMQQRHGQY